MKINRVDFKKTVCLLLIFINFFFSYVGAEGGNLPDIDAGAAAVMDMDTGRLLFGKNHHMRRPMASTTKIMTAILAIERCGLEEVVTVSKRATRIGGSGMNLKEGEKCTVRELLYGLLLPSGNDAAIALAEHIAGSVEDFAEIMNQKAWQIGARNTQFKNPHGLDADGHYTTAYDMAVIACYALRNTLFSEIVSTKQVTIGNRQLYNTNEMLGSYPGADGVKTGYTGKAGRCLVTSATRDGRRLVSVVLFCRSRYQRADISRKILDYAFNNFNNYVLTGKNDFIANLPVVKGKSNCTEVRAADAVSFPLTEEEYRRIRKVVDLPESIDAPVYAGIDVGTVSYVLDGEVIAQSKLKAWNTVEKKTIYDYFMDVIRKWLGIYRQ